VYITLVTCILNSCSTVVFLPEHLPAAHSYYFEMVLTALGWYQVHSSSIMLNRKFDEHFAELDITPQQMTVLLIDLSRKLDTGKSTSIP
jgi:hypothetical protein